MCAKKKAIPSKIWRMAGEPIYAQPLSTAEQERLAEEFSIYRRFRGSSEKGMTWVTPAAARLHQSAAQSVAALLCERYTDRYERDAVVKIVASSTAIPAPLSDRMANREDFLLGAALWLLDHWEDHCGNEDEHLSLLPPEPDNSLEYGLPFIHSRETIPRLLNVLYGRDKEYRKEFRALLELVEDDAATELRRLFKDAFLDYIDRALEIQNRLRFRQAEREMPAFPAGLSSRDWFLDDLPLPSEDPAVVALLMAPELICRPASEIQEELSSRKAAELLSGYGTDEPYALCAAYLLLEREKDALANLNVLTAIVMTCAARHLLWTQDDFDARAGLFEQGGPDYRMRYEYRRADEDGKIAQNSPPDWLVSEAQLFYIATGVVPPRNQRPSEELIRWFTEQGIMEPRARELAFGAMFAYYSDAGEHGWKDIDWFSDEDDEEEAEPSDGLEKVTEDTAAPAHISDAQNKVDALIRQVKELRAALHDAERAAGRLKEQLRMAEQKGEADRAELARLRETLYDLRGGEAPETGNSGPLVEIPWQVKRRVVVFGGHDSWRKAVKPLLPGARFYDREVLPDINAIRGAEVVWLQINALSHKYYYRIIDIARRNDIPVRYFGSASAQKCAVQLAMDELHTV